MGLERLDERGDPAEATHLVERALVRESNGGTGTLADLVMEPRGGGADQVRLDGAGAGFEPDDRPENGTHQRPTGPGPDHGVQAFGREGLSRAA